MGCCAKTLCATIAFIFLAPFIVWNVYAFSQYQSASLMVRYDCRIDDCSVSACDKSHCISAITLSVINPPASTTSSSSDTPGAPTSSNSATLSNTVSILNETMTQTATQATQEARSTINPSFVIASRMMCVVNLTIDCWFGTLPFYSVGLKDKSDHIHADAGSIAEDVTLDDPEPIRMLLFFILSVACTSLYIIALMAIIILIIRC